MSRNSEHIDGQCCPASTVSLCYRPHMDKGAILISFLPVNREDALPIFRQKAGTEAAKLTRKVIESGHAHIETIPSNLLRNEKSGSY